MEYLKIIHALYNKARENRLNIEMSCGLCERDTTDVEATQIGNYVVIREDI